MACSSIAVSPQVFLMSSQETLPLTFDATPLLLEGESIQNATVQLVQVDTGLDYASGRLGSPAVAGTEVTQTVTGLLPRKRYRLVMQLEVAVNKIWAPYLMIECPS